MFKKILPLLLVSFLFVSAGTITKTYRVGNSLRVKDGHIYIEDGRPCMEGFAPAVAVKGMVLACPRGQKAKIATVTYGKLVQVPGNHTIKPAIPAYHTQGRPSKFNRQNIYQDAAARELLARYYEKDALYPGISESYPVGNQFKYGVACAVVVVHPVQYNPVREELFYYDQVTVSIETEQISPADQIAAYVMTPFHRSVLQFTVDNPEALADLELTPRDGDDYEVLVITYPVVQSKFDDYVALNKRRGLRTKVALIADVLQTAGPTNQDKIRNYIKNEYENSKIVFCVLGGDINQIIARELYSESYDHNKTPDRFLQKYSGSDLYYVTLDGNWNDDGDGKYGEPGEEDLLWEVYIGRMPVDNTTHLTNMLTKTTHYCETPVIDQVTNVLLAGEFLWDDYGKTIWGIDNLEYCVGYKDAFGYKTYGWSDKCTISRISDKETGAANGWDGSDLRGKILSAKPAWIDHDGHANTTYCYTINASSIASTFTNTGTNQNYWIGVSQVGCNPGQFKVSDCWMEVAVLSDKGAVAMQGNWDSGFADDDDNNSQSTLVCRYERDALFNPAKRIPFLAAAHAIGKEALIDVSTDPNAINLAPYYGLIRYCSYNTNTLGDPALSVWTDTPKDVTATTFAYTADGNGFTMETPPYTCIALANTSNDEIITAQITGYKYTGGANFIIGDSTCSITDDAYKTYAAGNNKVKVYIKAPNYLPGAFEITLSTDISNSIANKIHQFSVKTIKGKLLVNFALPVNEHVNVSVYNSKGVLVKTLLNEINTVDGLQTVKLDDNDLSNGIYYCKLKTKNAQNVDSFVVTK